nr:hypothetical protein [Rhodococcus wratislaviensis]
MTDDEREVEGPLISYQTAEEAAAGDREYHAERLAEVELPMDIEVARRTLRCHESDIFAHQIDGDGMAPSDVMDLYSFAENLLDALEVAQAQLAARKSWWQRLIGR